MLKRKNSQYYYNDNNNDNIKYDIIYKNLKNCDSIKKKDNSIYFNSTIRTFKNDCSLFFSECNTFF
mgnify:CR=1 FL=1